MAAAQDEGPRLYPAWKQAESDLLAEGLRPGQVITREWLESAFGIKPANDIAQYKKNELVFLRQFTDLRDSLLETHALMLRPLVGVGYQVVLPENQTAVAMRDRTNEVRAALGKLAREISHVRHEALTDAQRKENTDAVAKVGGLVAMVRKRLR